MASDSFIASFGDEIRELRNDFSALSQTMNGKPLAYLDTASSAQKPKAVLEVQSHILHHGYSNIHRGLYKISQDLTAEYEAVRAKVAGFLKAETEKEIVFTANATDAINLVAQSWGRANLKQGDEIILTEMEHHANIVPWQILRDQIGVVLKIIPVLDDGTLDLSKLETLLSPKTRAISMVHVSNALGVINPVRDVIAKVKAYNAEIIAMVDGSQSAVHMSVDVQDLGADFFCFTGHKLYGPTGVGVLYGRYDVLSAMPPFKGGGDMIETVSFDETLYKDAPFRFEAGTPPIMQVIGLGAAIDYLEAICPEARHRHEQELLRVSTSALRDIPGLQIHGDVTEKAGIVSFTIEGIHTSDIATILDQCGVAVRTGHHCCMPLMQRFGLDGTVRASFGVYSNVEDVKQLVSGINKARELLL